MVEGMLIKSMSLLLKQTLTSKTYIEERDK